jgi:xanthine/CO dehydrogenase XdhC/CoxF family maturation factor
MVVLPDGSSVGAISGGCLEKDVLAHAERVRSQGVAMAVAYDLTSDDDMPWGLNMGCAAKIDVLLEPAPTGEAPQHLAFVLGELAKREPAVVATVFKAPAGGPAPGARLYLSGDGRSSGPLAGAAGEVAGWLSGEARRVMRERRSEAVTRRTALGEMDALVEYVPLPVQLVLCGAGADVEPLCRLGRELGWQVRIVGKDEPLEGLDERSAVVIMTHNYGRDLALLEALLASSAGYIGVLGPKGRTERLLQDLKSNGREPEPDQARRLFAPVGLDLGAETPEEIALAVAAEVRAVFAGRRGGMLRERKGPIHDRR